MHENFQFYGMELLYSINHEKSILEGDWKRFKRDHSYPASYC